MPGGWSGAITTGNAARVLAQADAHGLDKTLFEVDSPALVALADASRYTGRPELAVRALLAQRQRFPDTPAAHAAAFLLGRLADDRGEVAAGLAWYRRYLAETPNGPYAAEALGRKMLAVERISGRTPRAAWPPNTSNAFPTGPTCSRRTRSSRIRRRDASAPHARESMRSSRAGRGGGAGRDSVRAAAHARRARRARDGGGARRDEGDGGRAARRRSHSGRGGPAHPRRAGRGRAEQPRRDLRGRGRLRAAAKRPRRPRRSRCRGRTASPPSA